MDTAHPAPPPSGGCAEEASPTQGGDVFFVSAYCAAARPMAPPPLSPSPVDPATAAAIHAAYQADLAAAEGDEGGTGGAGGPPSPSTRDDAALAAELAAADAAATDTGADPGPSTSAPSAGDDLFDLLDPTPDVHGLFAHYNALYFGGTLGSVSVEWAPRMTLCAGTCSFSRAGGARIRLSAPLLSLRPSADLKNTLLHEMVHAAIFLSGQRDTGDHGSLFMAHAARINGGAGNGASLSARVVLHDPVRPPGGYRIEAYHAFHAEVEAFRVHHWRCGGPCGGLVKRASNRPPQPADCVRAGRRRGGGPCDGRGCWWHGHAAACGGEWTKVAGPPPKKKGPGGGRAKGRVVGSAAAGGVGGSGHQPSLDAFFGAAAAKAAAGGRDRTRSPPPTDRTAPPPPPSAPVEVILLDSSEEEDGEGDEPGEGPVIVLD